MREILFRGKRIDNGEWVYGGLAVVGNETTYSSIVDESWVNIPVLTETVGQFTGLTADDSKVFEGDIISIRGITGKFVVEYDEEEAAFYAVRRDNNGKIIGWTQFKDDDTIFIEGNINDNLGLLEVQDERKDL